MVTSGTKSVNPTMFRVFRTDKTSFRKRALIDGIFTAIRGVQCLYAVSWVKNPTFILFQLLVAERIEETLQLMTSSLLVALSHQLQTVVQNSPVHGNLVSRMIMSVITMMTAVTTRMNLDVVWQFNNNNNNNDNN